MMWTLPPVIENRSGQVLVNPVKGNRVTVKTQFSKTSPNLKGKGRRGVPPPYLKDYESVRYFVMEYIEGYIIQERHQSR